MASEGSLRRIATRAGNIPLPAYVPVTTFGGEYPLDELVRPYLRRLAPAVMVSWHYAAGMDGDSGVGAPLLVDSGGFAALAEASDVVPRGKCAALRTPDREDASKTRTLHPKDVLDLQERVADVAFALDFPIPPKCPATEAARRTKLTIANAFWALENRRRRDLPLFACVQARDAKEARTVARTYAGGGFDGVAIGGLVPRARDEALLASMVRAVREEVGDLPLHVFGLGKPSLVRRLFDWGADSVDSSAYLQLAAAGRLWEREGFELPDPSPLERMHLALCNLAVACSATLPLSAAGVLFNTNALLARMTPVRSDPL